MIWMLVLEEVNLLVFTPHFNRGGGNTIPTELYYEEMHAFDSHSMIFWDSGKERKKKKQTKKLPQKLLCMRTISENKTVTLYTRASNY